jgi:hypothetical protein
LVDVRKPVPGKQRFALWYDANVRLFVLLIAIAYVLHQDWWFWHTATPLVLGFIPVGLFYHVIYTVAMVGLMWLLVRRAWPSHLERDEP